MYSYLSIKYHHFYRFFFLLKIFLGDFPGSPVVRTPRFLCRGYGLDPWPGNQDPASCTAQPKKKNLFVKNVFFELTVTEGKDGGKG